MQRAGMRDEGGVQLVDAHGQPPERLRYGLESADLPRLGAVKAVVAPPVY
jgi:hypothetical protein